MRKIMGFVVVLACALLGCLAFNAQDTYADDLVSSAEVYWAPGWSWRDSSGHWQAMFSVSLTPTSECEGCKAVGYFYCNDGGAGLDEWGGDTASGSEGWGISYWVYTDYWGEEDGVKWWRVYIDPPYDSWQPLIGWMSQEGVTQDTAFKGTTSVTGINGDSDSTSEKTITGANASVSFYHRIVRNDDLEGDVRSKTLYQVKSQYRTKPYNGSWSEWSKVEYGFDGDRLSENGYWHGVTWTDLMYYNTDNTTHEPRDTYKYNGLAYGEKVEICQQIWLRPNVAITNGDYATSGDAWSNWACATVTRKMPTYTLKAYAGVNGTYNSSTDTRTYLKSDGSTTANASESWTDSVTVNHGATATVDTGGFNPVGYTWATWGSSCAVSERNDRKCSRKNMTANGNVYAYYDRNAFSGRASVAQGKNWGNSGTVRDLTGWVRDDKSVSIDVDCANTGCDTNYWLELRTDVGSGETGYWTGVSKNGGSIKWTPSGGTATSITPSSDSGGTMLVGESKTVGEYQQLKPGESLCRQLAFYPFAEFSNTTWKTAQACANAKVTNFEGQSNVTGATTVSAGYTNSSKEVIGEIANCSSSAGCKVKFNHKLKSSGSIGSTGYTISRSSNLTTGTYAIANSTSLATGTFSGAETTVYESDELTLYPGMKVCETITFKPNNNTVSVASDVSVRACVYAKGNAQPPDPSNPNEPEDSNKNPSSGAFLNIKVRNNEVSKYNDYQKVVYAKPTSKVTFRAVYNPKLQYAYNIVPDKMMQNGGSLKPSGRNTSKLGTLFSGWNNAFAVVSNNFSGSQFSKSYTGYTKGDTSIHWETNEHQVKNAEVGRTLKEYARTNTESSNKTTPSQVIFTSQSDNSGYYTIANVITTQIESVADVNVPYNYDTSIDVAPQQEKIGAGESGTVDVTVKVLPKTNGETTNGGNDEAYATIMPDARVKLVVYAPGNNTTRNGSKNYGNKDSNICDRYTGSSTCQTMDVRNASAQPGSVENFNEQGSLNGATIVRKPSFNVPDLDAGAEICVAAAVYPSNSGTDTNLEPNGSGTWNVSQSRCFQLIKKPSLQVWGGGIYSSGDINTAVSAKKQVAGVNSYYIQGNANGHYVFGSWAELGVVSIGTNRGFASGASTGYAFNNNGVLQPNPKPADGDGNTGTVIGGSWEKALNFCVRSVLTFANDDCDNGTAGNLGGSGIKTAENNKSDLIARFRGDETIYHKIGGVSSISEIANSLSEFGLSNGGNGVVLDAGKTIVVAMIGGGGLVANNDLTIDRNIVFLDNQYSKLEDVPKLILYANNIKINCDVTRIDAVLIAEDDVNTCANSNNINSSMNSNQLRINGAIITDTLTANRTYGAAKGANSMVSAEIVDYDATLYLWGANKTDVTNTAKVTMTYIRELSPRY